MKNRIALKLLVFFAAALLFFAMVSSLTFGSLFKESIKDTKRAEMLDRASHLSRMLSQALEGTRSGGMLSGGHGSGYINFVRLLSQAEPNLWVLDENLAFLSSGRMMGMRLEYTRLPPDAEQLVRDVFRGGTSFSEGFSELAGTPTLTVGAPVFHNGEVAGALLLNDAVSGMDEAIRKGQGILLYSAAAALILSIVLSVILSYTFTRPISRMEKTAQKLSEGDYEARTGITQKDEIGDLAKSIDLLSDRLQKTREDQEWQEQLRRDFLANVSHELRTPVTVLRGSLEALSDGVVSDPSLTEDYYRQMLNETKGLQRLVDDLMELSRLQNTDFPIESAPLIIQEVFADALRAAEQLVKDSGIRIVRDAPKQPVSFTGDYARLKQMLLIALDNAIKFSEPGSMLYVDMDRSGITIRDEGRGIPEADLPYIFDRFYKSRSEGNHHSSGLGLAIAKGIADRHGMRVDVHSAEGSGTTVRFIWI